MKSILAISAALLALSALAAAEPPQSDEKTKKSAAAQPEAPPATPALKTIQPLTIPKDAKPGENGTYKYTDKDGKKWIYVATPFGISRSADMGPAPEHYTAPIATTVVDLGDSVRFERPGPFGPIRWEKKKSELSDDERYLLDSHKPAGPPEYQKPDSRKSDNPGSDTSGSEKKKAEPK
jgi:hypothetical protein